jgi:hypothetical protein
MVYGGAGGLAADLHFRPYRLVDPYLVVGAGYRLFFVSPAGPPHNHMFHGFEPLKTDVGVDFRISKDFALGPKLSADLNVFVWDLDETEGVNRVIDQKSVSTFFFAGVGGKFDVLGKRVAEPGHQVAGSPAGPTPADATIGTTVGSGTGVR